MTDHFPSELGQSIRNFDQSIKSVEEALQPLFSKPFCEQVEELSAVDRARVGVVSAFALNSLVWMKLRTMGINPKESEVKTELDRVKAVATRLKQIDDEKIKRSHKVDTEAAKRLLTSSLWTPGEKKIRLDDKSNK